MNTQKPFYQLKKKWFKQSAMKGMPARVVQVKQVEKRILQDNRILFKDVSFSAREGDAIVISGPSGCGKTMLAKILLGLVTYDGGDIDFFGRPLKKWLAGNPLIFRQKVQLILQNPQQAFSPFFSVRSTLEDVWQSHFGTPNAAFEKRLHHFLERVGLEGRLLNSFPEDLSGGESQRFAILRALLLQPKLLICDEITASLDVITKQKLFHLLAELRNEFNMTLLFISHEPVLLPNITPQFYTMPTTP